MPSGVKKQGDKWVVFDKRTGKVKSRHSSKRKASISASIRDREAKKSGENFENLASKTIPLMHRSSEIVPLEDLYTVKNRSQAPEIIERLES